MKHLYALALALFVACGSADARVVGVSTFGPLRLGAPGPVQTGQPTALPHATVPPATFFVLVVAKGIPTMCTFEDCGIEGSLVEKLGGWITGDDQAETIASVGLNEHAVRKNRQSIIVVADKSGRIVGIYPRRTMKDLPAILEAHRSLWRANSLIGAPR